MDRMQEDTWATISLKNAVKKRSWRWAAVCLLVMSGILALSPAALCQDYRVGTWKTPQTIQPFFYEHYLSSQQHVEVYSFTNPADQKLALLAGSLDMCGTTLSLAIHAASRGEPVVVVSALCNKCSALVVKKDGPITSVAELRGRRIGYVPGTMHEILLRETLSQAGINPDVEARLTRVDFFDMGIALAGGGIDAFLSGEPFPSLASREGYGVILAYPYFEDTIGTINAGMLVTRQAIRKNPGMVHDLVKAHALATEYLAEHKQQWLEKASTFGTSIEVLEMALPNMELAWYMDETFVARARALGERMQKLGLIENQPDYDRLFDLSFVRRVQEDIRLDKTAGQ